MGLEFQTLIGTVKREVMEMTAKEIVAFQTLIGTVKSRC